MIPIELKSNVSCKLLVACLSTAEMETGPFKVSKHPTIRNNSHILAVDGIKCKNNKKCFLQKFYQ